MEQIKVEEVSDVLVWMDAQAAVAILMMLTETPALFAPEHQSLRDTCGIALDELLRRYINRPPLAWCYN